MNDADLSRLRILLKEETNKKRQRSHIWAKMDADKQISPYMGIYGHKRDTDRQIQRSPYMGIKWTQIDRYLHIWAYMGIKWTQNCICSDLHIWT